MQAVLFPTTAVGMRVARRTAEALEQSVLITAQDARLPPQTASHLLFCCGHLPLLPQPLIVFDGRYSGGSPPREGVGLLLHEDAAGAEQARGWGMPVFSCGMSPRDAVTLSSDTGDAVVLSLQRTLRTLSGREREPFEMPLSAASRIPRGELLLAAAVLLMLEREDDIPRLPLL